ncbi:MAG TPA: Crp/Fnr family transcriptional regulator [Bryobacteraceae bacterium]|nr:Crp/Fnr family transcriptional regulator [Bryobacteraceae bacterium]
MSQGAPSPRQILEATPLFAALDDAELSSLADRCEVHPYSAGEVLFSEGERCKGLYIVVSGRVRILKTSLNGREQVLAMEGPGASVAELPVFDGGNYPASCAAAERTEALFVSRADLRAICMEKPEVALKMLQVRHRLISYLIREAQAKGQAGGRGVTISLDASHQELASQIGTVLTASAAR